MKDLPYFRWYAKDAETDENFKAMTDAEVGFYLRCLDHSWLNGGLPADLAERAKVLQRPRSYVERQWKRVGHCFKPDMNNPARLINPRQEQERLKALTKSEKATKSIRSRYERSSNVAIHALVGAGSGSGSGSSGNGERKSETIGGFDVPAGFLELWEAYPAKGRIKHPMAQQAYVDRMDPLTDAERRAEHARMMEPIRAGGKWAESDMWDRGFVSGIENYIRQHRDGESPEPRKRRAADEQYTPFVPSPEVAG